jgi:hypothetical protein
MRRIIIAFMLIGLLLAAGCDFETSEEKAARLEQERQRQIQLEQERIQKEKEYQEKLNKSMEKCDSVHEDNRTYCYAEEAAGLDRMEGVDRLCGMAGNMDYCYFYVALVNKNKLACKGVSTELQVGCMLAADASFCNTVSNKLDCMESRAELMYFYNKDESKTICYYLESMKNFDEDSVCYDIDAEEEEYDFEEYDLSTKVLMTYVLAELGEYTVTTKRVRY